MSSVQNIPRVAPGVEYSTFPGCAKVLFQCTRLSARLSTDACSERYRVAVQTEAGQPGGTHSTCRSCPIGADHAGQDVVVFSRLFGSDICPRCGKGTTRMIQDRICVSCRNREYELARGRNAKGTVPVNIRPLFPIALAFTVNGTPRIYRARLATGLQETVVQVLRKIKGRITFAFHGDTSHLRQQRLL